MMPLPEMGKLLVVAGLILAGLGRLFWSGLGKGWLGGLPGDINYSHGNFGLQFPLATCVLLASC